MNLRSFRNLALGLVLTVTLTAGGSQLALAQEITPATGPAATQGQDKAEGHAEGGKPCRERMLKQFDANGDGQLDDSERQKAKESRQGAMGWLKMFDRNGDGQLDEAERQAAEQKKGEVRQQLMQRFDSNGDGKLDESERTAAKAAFQQKREELKHQFDANGDGQLDEAERQQLRDHLMNHRVF